LPHLREKRRGTGFVPAVANFPDGIFFAAEFSWQNFPGGIRRWFHTPYFVGDNAKAAQASAGSASTPERGPAGPVHRVGKGRFAILFAVSFELLLGFPEARDAGCDFGPVTRESFFLLCHRPSVSCFDSRPAIIGARDWGVNAEARLRHYESPAAFEAKVVDKLWRILVAHAGSR
jgi:hypothetical protein